MLMIKNIVLSSFLRDNERFLLCNIIINYLTIQLSSWLYLAANFSFLILSCPSGAKILSCLDLDDTSKLASKIQFNSIGLHSKKLIEWTWTLLVHWSWQTLGPLRQEKRKEGSLQKKSRRKNRKNKLQQRGKKTLQGHSNARLISCSLQT